MSSFADPKLVQAVGILGLSSSMLQRVSGADLKHTLGGYKGAIGRLFHNNCSMQQWLALFYGAVDELLKAPEDDLVQAVDAFVGTGGSPQVYHLQAELNRATTAKELAEGAKTRAEARAAELARAFEVEISRHKCELHAVTANRNILTFGVPRFDERASNRLYRADVRAFWINGRLVFSQHLYTRQLLQPGERLELLRHKLYKRLVEWARELKEVFPTRQTGYWTVEGRAMGLLDIREYKDYYASRAWHQKYETPLPVVESVRVPRQLWEGWLAGAIQIDLTDPRPAMLMIDKGEVPEGRRKDAPLVRKVLLCRVNDDLRPAVW